MRQDQLELILNTIEEIRKPTTLKEISKLLKQKQKDRKFITYNQLKDFLIILKSKEQLLTNLELYELEEDTLLVPPNAKQINEVEK